MERPLERDAVGVIASRLELQPLLPVLAATRGGDSFLVLPLEHRQGVVGDAPPQVCNCQSRRARGDDRVRGGFEMLAQPRGEGARSSATESRQAERAG